LHKADEWFDGFIVADRASKAPGFPRRYRRSVNRFSEFGADRIFFTYDERSPTVSDVRRYAS